MEMRGLSPLAILNQLQTDDKSHAQCIEVRQTTWQVGNTNVCIIGVRISSSYAHWWHAMDGTGGGKRIAYSTLTFHRYST